jgi:hypothetical protein
MLLDVSQVCIARDFPSVVGCYHCRVNMPNVCFTRIQTRQVTALRFYKSIQGFRENLKQAQFIGAR